MTDRVDFESIFECLNAAGVVDVCVGGVAVVLHGVDRLTADVDLVVELGHSNALAAIEALLQAGFRARIPADPRGFADPDVRRAWIDERDMKDISFWDPSGDRPDVDLFVEYPLDFDALLSSAEEVALQRTHCRIASTEHLVQMKRAVGRDKDLQDIEALNERKQFNRQP